MFNILFYIFTNLNIKLSFLLLYFALLINISAKFSNFLLWLVLIIVIAAKKLIVNKEFIIDLTIDIGLISDGLIDISIKKFIEKKI